MHVVSVCPLRVASLPWQTPHGSWALTVVCKATYQLAPGESALAESQEYVQEEENHWNDDAAHSLYAPSDLVPFKPQPEVSLVGHAFAPAGEHVTRLLVHLVVGEVDKSIEIRGDQSILRDGALREGPRFGRMPLRYERAAGGAGTHNPVGIQLDSPNTLGILLLPNLRPPGLAVVRPGDFIEPVGFGPIAASWPTRRQRLGRLAGHWSEAALSREPLPDGLDPYYFMSAPRDQALTVLRPDERLVLENLHAAHPRLATSLPGIEPRAFVELPHQPAAELRLVCDTLWIDTDRSIATLTWRGQVALQRPEQEGRVVVAMEKAGRPLSWAEVEPLTRETRERPARSLRPEVQEVQTRMTRMPPVAPALPFSEARGQAALIADPETERPVEPAARRGDSTVPYRGQRIDAAAGPAWLRRPPASAPPAPPPPAPPMPIVAAVPMVVPLAPSPMVVPMAAPPPPPPPAPIAPILSRAPGSSPWAAGTGPGSSPGLASGTIAPVAPVVPATVIPLASPSSSGASWLHAAPGVTPGPAPEAQDKLGLGSPRASIVDLREAADPGGSLPLPAPSSSPSGTREHVALLGLDPAGLPKIRAAAALLREPGARAGATSWLKDDSGAREEAQEVRDRRDALAVLTRTPPVGEEGLGHVVAAAFHDDGTYEPPVTVVAGELAVAFDEIETLKATITVTTPFMGTDKKLRDMVTAATEVLKAEWPAPGDIAEGFTGRIEEAFAQGPRAVAPGYLQSSVKRMLLEGRSYQKKTIFGEKRIRALLTLAGGRSAIPAYLPEALGPRLPLFLRFRVSAVVELRPQEDQYEAYGQALVVLALGRLLRERG